MSLFHITTNDRRYNGYKTKYYKIDCNSILTKLSNLNNILNLRITHMLDKDSGQEITLFIDLRRWCADRIELSADQDRFKKDIEQSQLDFYATLFFDNLDKFLFDDKDIYEFHIQKTYDSIYHLEFLKVDIQKYTKINDIFIHVHTNLELYDLGENDKKPYDNYINPWTINEVNKIINLTKDIKKLNLRIDDEEE